MSPDLGLPEVVRLTSNAARSAGLRVAGQAIRAVPLRIAPTSTTCVTRARSRTGSVTNCPTTPHSTVVG